MYACLSCLSVVLCVCIDVDWKYCDVYTCLAVDIPRLFLSVTFYFLSVSEKPLLSNACLCSPLNVCLVCESSSRCSLGWLDHPNCALLAKLGRNSLYSVRDK